MFNLDIQAELRFATITKYLGYGIDVLPKFLSKNFFPSEDEDKIKEIIIKNPNIKGILHPVKKPVEQIIDLES